MMNLDIDLLLSLSLNDFISLLNTDKQHYELRKLKIDGINICNNFPITIKNTDDIDEFINNEIFEYFGNIIVSYLTINDDELIKLLKYVKNIYRLVINNCRNISDKPFSYMSGIHTLSMAGCINISDKAFSHISSVKKLNISLCNQISDNISIYLKNVNTLNLTGCYQFSNDILRNLTKLKKLNISLCDKFDDDIISIVFNNNTHLEELEISCCEQFSDNIFSTMFNSNLKALNITGCKQFNEDVIKYCGKLKILKISGCHRLINSSLLSLCCVEIININLDTQIKFTIETVNRLKINNN